MEKRSKIFVAGRHTLIGEALLRELERQGYENIAGSRNDEPELTSQTQVDSFFARTLPEYVFLAAGKSGGIKAYQKYPAELMYDNLLVECHVVHSAYLYRVRKLLYLASSCVYPRLCPQPMAIETLMMSPLEPTNEAYAVAKLAGLSLCRAYRRQYGRNFVSAIPANAFGPGDDFSHEDSHVIAALIRRMHDAKTLGQKSVTIWGSGQPRREFIFADELAVACIFTMTHYDGADPINLGVGADLSIRELAELVREVIGYSGELQFDPSQPDGMPAKLLDSSRIKALGWKSQMPMRSALEATYRWFVENEIGKGTEDDRAVL
jgi:GDP-L-fucose synthase